MTDIKPKHNEDDELDLLMLARVLWAGKWRMVFYGLLGVTLCVVYLLNTKPTFLADALLQLEEKSGGLALPEGLEGLVDDSPLGDTEIRIVLSRLTLAKVVADLNLDWSAQPKLAPVFGTFFARFDVPLPAHELLTPYARPGDMIELGFLQVPPEWLGEAFDLVYLGDATFEVILPDGDTLEGHVGQMLSEADKGFSLEILSLSATVGRHFELVQEHELTAIEDMRDNLSIGEAGRQTGILMLTYTHTNPLMAKRVLQAITQSYVGQNAARAAAEADSSLGFIEGQLPETRGAVETAEQALNRFMEEQQTIDIGFESENLLTQITTVENQLTALLGEEDRLLERYTANHPEFQLLLAQRVRLEDRLKDLRLQVVELPETQQDIIKLNRDLELAQITHTEMLKRAQEIRVLRASSIGNVRIVDDAATAIRPIAPRMFVLLPGSLLFGLVFGAGLVFLRHIRRNAIQSPQEIEAIGLAVFATINRSALAEKHAKNRKQQPILALVAPDAIEVEAIRSLRSGLHFTMFDAANKAFAITSAAPGAGKSFISTNLAVVSAQAGQKVCLIDCDMRRGMLYRSFGLKKGHAGLAEHLVGDIDLNEALQDTAIDGLSFMNCGRYPPNPSELLVNKNFGKLLENLEQDFDLILLDCPPILAVTDPAIIGRAAGTLGFVVHFDTTSIAELEASQRALETSGAKINGVILNGFDPQKARAAGANSYTYSYDYKTRT